MRFALLAVLSVAGFGLAMASVQFESVPFAWKASERSVISTAPGAVFGEPQSIELKQLAKTRITFGSSMMGQLYTGTGRSVDAWRCVDNCESIERGGATVSDNPTGFALYQVGSEMLGVAQFGEVPGVAQTFLIDRDANQKDNLQIKNGLTAYVWVESAGNPFGGLWRPVSAAASRWNTHLGTEDVPDAYQFEQFNCVASVGDPKPEEACLDSKDPNLAVDIMNMLRFQDYHPSDHLSALQDKRRDSTLNNFNLYKYGWVFEARPQLTSGAARLASQQKHYAMGRGGYQGIFTATNKVVYMTGGQGGLFRFIADASSDLSSGTLYGANYTYRAGGYDVEWTRLGSGSDDVLKGSPLNNAFSSNFFNLESENSNNCPAGSQFAAYWYNGGLRRECLKIGNAPIIPCTLSANLVAEGHRLQWTDDSNAPFFETNRYAASNGVDLTTFLFSGISASYLGQDGKIYITAKQVNALGAGPANSCGCVFSATLDNDQSINRLEPVLCGDSTAGTDSENVCNKDRLARPISVAVVPDYDMIVVGEEGGRTVGHYNPALWSINLNSRGALRMVTAPPHSSLMSGFFPQLQGQSWMPIAAAHPYQGITDTEILRNGTGPRAWLMYFGPITLDFSTASSDVAVFEPVTFPFGSVYAEKALLRGSRRITEGPHRSLPRRKLFSDGDRLGTGSKNATMGQLLDETGAPVIQLMDPGDTSSNSPIRSRTDDEDFTMEMTSATLIAQGQGCEDRKTIVVQYGAALPSMSYVLDVDFTGSTIQVDSAQVVNTTRIGGGWLLGAGVTSPWNTHVSGEVMDPDARIYSSAPCFNAGSGCLKQRDNAQYLRIMHFVRYFGFYQVEDVAAITKEQISAMYDPYRFGFVTEVKANVQGCVASKKLYNMGRFSHQGIAMMPDGKTVYMADSDNYGGLFRFRALQNGRLGGTGTLAVAQLQGDFDTSDLSKLDPRRERNYTIEWIELGTATSAEIEALVNDGTTFDDIWDFEEPTERSVGNSQNTFVCADGFTPVYLRQNTLNHPDIRPECLRLKSGMDKAAAFLETRRYAAFKGATMEFYMSGGMTFSEKASAMFLAVPTITLRMADNDGDGERFADGSFFGNNHIAGLDENNCGCVFRFPVNPQSFDSGRMEAYKCGRLGNQEVGDAPSGNQCSIERVASPRYLNSILGQDQLLVGEATGGGHQNAIVWGIDLLTGAQSRVVSSPEGEAAVATNIYQNVRGQDVVLIPVQGSDDANKAGGLYYLGPVDTFGTSDPVYLCYQFADEPAGVYECPEGVDLSSAPPSPPPISPPPPSPPPSPPPPPPSIAPPPDGGDGTPTSEPGFGNNGNGSTATIEPSSSPDGNNAHARHPLPFAAALAVLAAALLQALLTL